MSLRDEIAKFRERATERPSQAQAALSLQLLCGEDLAAAMTGKPEERQRIRAKLVRHLERERQRGLRRHWSYDLNRHIGLRQALDMLADRQGGRCMQVDD